MSYPGSPIHQFDKLDYEETCHDLDIEETESDNATNETREVMFEPYKPKFRPWEDNYTNARRIRETIRRQK